MGGGKCKERHSILAPKYTSILEGQKACYSGQTLDVQWCCHLINLFFVSKGKPVKGSTYSIVASAVQISSVIEFHKVISVQLTAAHALFNNQKLQKLGLPPATG